LPNIAAATDVTVATSGNATVLRWHDSGRGADMEIQVDSASGTPLSLQQTPRDGGAHVLVVYRGWNIPVDIAPPAAP
jgi:outer membrane lipoprotein-sorting protein